MQPGEFGLPVQLPTNVFVPKVFFARAPLPARIAVLFESATPPSFSVSVSLARSPYRRSGSRSKSTKQHLNREIRSIATVGMQVGHPQRVL
jgi:hypothetical protein